MTDFTAHSSLRRETFVIPWRGKPKPRPRVTRHGTHNPREYTEWKGNVAEYIAAATREKFEGPVKVSMEFYSDEVAVIIQEYTSADSAQMVRAKYVTADIDNLVGGVMDAMQDSGLIENDKQVVNVSALVSLRWPE
jgi:Holliday junction resolvase RusA-like endonuclease